MKPKPRGAKKKDDATITPCANCEAEKPDTELLDCELCEALICTDCASVPLDVINFIAQKELTIPVICSKCKDEIPQLRELKGIKDKQAEADKLIKELQDENEQMRETMRLQGEEINKLVERFNKHLDTQPNIPVPSFADILGNAQANTDFSSIVRTEVSERAEIEKLKNNLVVSGIEETNNDDRDKAAVKAMLEGELDLTLDIQSTERIGKIKDGVPTRLLRLKFVTMRSRKELLAKCTELRNSANEHVKNNVYVRPDLTTKQQKEKKNLRVLLKKKRQENPDQTYKIYRNQIVCTSLAEEQGGEEAT